MYVYRVIDVVNHTYLECFKKLQLLQKWSNKLQCTLRCIDSPVQCSQSVTKITTMGATEILYNSSTLFFLLWDQKLYIPIESFVSAYLQI